MPHVDRTASPFSERLFLPWWLWPLALGGALVLAFEVHLGAQSAVTWVTYTALPLLTAAGLLWLGRIRVAVVDDTLHVDDARLPVSVIAAAEPLSGSALRDALGVALHPVAFVVQRPWVRGAVRIVLDDPADPTPYWIVSSRHPERLAAVLTAAASATGESADAVGTASGQAPEAAGNGR